MIRKRPELNTENPPGQIVNPIGLPHHVGGRTDAPIKETTLGDYISRKEQEYKEQIKAYSMEETPDDAYLRGYNDGIAEGFQRGIRWAMSK